MELWWELEPAPNGSSFGRGLAAGFIGAGKGLVTGALTGGLIRGTMDALNGYNFWNGTKTVNIISTNTGSSSGEIDHAKLTSELQAKTKELFNVQEGDYGIRTLTSQAPKDFQVAPNGAFVSTKDPSYLISGRTVMSSAGISDIHIAPEVIQRGDIVIFRATVGHEIIHARHMFVHRGNYNSDYSEAAAYKYSAKIYEAPGYWHERFLILQTRLKYNYFFNLDPNYPVY